MLALDQDEAEEIVGEYLKDHSAPELYDRVFIPALSRAKNDRRHNHLTERDEHAVYACTRAILDDLVDPRKNSGAEDTLAESAGFKNLPPGKRQQVLGFPAEGKSDEVALLALEKILDGTRYGTQILSADMLASEMVSLVEQKQPRLVCIGAVAPGGLAHARYLCKRIRARCPEVKIVVGRWGFSGNLENARSTLTFAGADRMASTLVEARDLISQLVQLERAEASPAPARQAAH
jgi:hypothetical protein